MEKETKVKDEPKVTVFGQDVGNSESENKCDDWQKDMHFRHHHHHHSGRGSFTWGFFLILAGIIFLLNTLNLLPWSVWSIVGHLWPILIILMGIDVIFSHSWFSRFLSFLLTFFVFATTLGIILMKVSPQLLTGFPTEITNFIGNVSSYLQLK